MFEFIDSVKWTSIPRFGIPRLQPREECSVPRGRSRYPLLRGIIRPASFRALCLWSLGLIIIGSLRLLPEGAPLLQSHCPQKKKFYFWSKALRVSDNSASLHWFQVSIRPLLRWWLRWRRRITFWLASVSAVLKFYFTLSFIRVYIKTDLLFFSAATNAFLYTGLLRDRDVRKRGN